MLILFILLILIITTVILFSRIRFSFSLVAAENGALLRYSFSVFKIVFLSKKKRISAENKAIYIYTYKNDKLISKKPLKLKKKAKPKKHLNKKAFFFSLKNKIKIEKFNLTAKIYTPKADLTAILSGIFVILISSVCVMLNLNEKNSDIEIKPEFEKTANLFNLSCIISLTIPNIITAYLKSKKAKE